MQDLNHKLASMVTNRETLERLCYTMKDEIADLANKIDNQSIEVRDYKPNFNLLTTVVPLNFSRLLIREFLNSRLDITKFCLNGLVA